MTQRTRDWSGLSPGDPRHALLLRAALAEGAEASAAYEAWRSDGDLDRPGFPDFPDFIASRLLPLVGWNLQASGLPCEDLPRLAQLHRESWTRNQRLFAEAAPAIAALERAGIFTLLLKGAALALTAYPSPGLRPMTDVDVLVPERMAAAARRVLVEEGWRPDPPEPEQRLAHLHAQGFVREAGGSPAALDLHWRALWEGREPAGDDAWWDCAEPLEAYGLETRVLSPADQLVQLSVHASHWGPRPACYAVADLVMLLRARGGRLDWDRVVHQARARRLVPAVSAALVTLGEFSWAPVPKRALDSLARAPVSLRERAEFRARRLPPALGRGLIVHWCDLAREAPRDSAVRRLGRFPSYLRETWGLESPWQVPVEAARKGWRRRPRPRADGGRERDPR